MRIVGRGHKRGIAGTVFLSGAIDGTTIHLADRQRLLQRRLLAGTDGFELIEVHQQIVSQCHFFVKLVREIQMIHVVLSQVMRQQATQKSGLATTLTANQRGHTLVAVQGVHLSPVSHSRAEPDTQEIQLFTGDAWNA